MLGVENGEVGLKILILAQIFRIYSVKRQKAFNMGSYGKDFLTFWALKFLIFELGSKFLDLTPHFRPQGWLYNQDRYQKFNIELSRGNLGNLEILPIGKPYKSV